MTHGPDWIKEVPGQTLRGFVATNEVIIETCLSEKLKKKKLTETI